MAQADKAIAMKEGEAIKQFHTPDHAISSLSVNVSVADTTALLTAAASSESTIPPSKKTTVNEAQTMKDTSATTHHIVTNVSMPDLTAIPLAESAAAGAAGAAAAGAAGASPAQFTMPENSSAADPPPVVPLAVVAPAAVSAVALLENPSVADALPVVAPFAAAPPAIAAVASPAVVAGQESLVLLVTESVQTRGADFSIPIVARVEPPATDQQVAPSAAARTVGDGGGFVLIDVPPSPLSIVIHGASEGIDATTLSKIALQPLSKIAVQPPVMIPSSETLPEGIDATTLSKIAVQPSVIIPSSETLPAPLPPVVIACSEPLLAPAAGSVTVGLTAAAPAGVVVASAIKNEEGEGGRQRRPAPPGVARRTRPRPADVAAPFVPAQAAPPMAAIGAPLMVESLVVSHSADARGVPAPVAPHPLREKLAPLKGLLSVLAPAPLAPVLAAPTDEAGISTSVPGAEFALISPSFLVAPATHAENQTSVPKTPATPAAAVVAPFMVAMGRTRVSGQSGGSSSSDSLNAATFKPTDGNNGIESADATRSQAGSLSASLDLRGLPALTGADRTQGSRPAVSQAVSSGRRARRAAAASEWTVVGGPAGAGSMNAQTDRAFGGHTASAPAVSQVQVPATSGAATLARPFVGPLLGPSGRFAAHAGATTSGAPGGRWAPGTTSRDVGIAVFESDEVGAAEGGFGRCIFWNMPQCHRAPMQQQPSDHPIAVSQPAGDGTVDGGGEEIHVLRPGKMTCRIAADYAWTLEHNGQVVARLGEPAPYAAPIELYVVAQDIIRLSPTQRPAGRAGAIAPTTGLAHNSAAHNLAARKRRLVVLSFATAAPASTMPMPPTPPPSAVPSFS
jgi:hypothetical protein